MEVQTASPCIVAPVAAFVLDCSVKSTGSYIQYSTSPSSYNKRDTSHSKRLSNLLEWQNWQLFQKNRTTLVVCKSYVKPTNQRCTHLSSIQSQSKRGMEEPWKRREDGHNIRLINFPMESVSKSPQDTQNEHSQSHPSSWWAKMILCNATSQRENCSWSIQMQNLEERSRKSDCIKKRKI